MQKELVEAGNKIAEIVKYANEKGYQFSEQELQEMIDAKRRRPE